MLDPSQGPQGAGSHAGTSSLILNYPTAMQFPAMPSPEKIVFTYDPDEFEKFVEEWVPALDSLYVRVVRQGGAGDHGIDVAAFLTRQGLEGSWHNYQCKRYKGTLAWSTAAGEIRKMFAGVVTGQFIVPEQYTFVAPSIGPSLQQALQRPVGTRKAFVEALRGSTDKVITDLGPRLRREAEELAAETSFEIFQTVNMKQMLEQHKTTEFWMKRFPPEFLLPAAWSRNRPRSRSRARPAMCSSSFRYMPSAGPVMPAAFPRLRSIPRLGRICVTSVKRSSAQNRCAASGKRPTLRVISRPSSRTFTMP